ncbi:hypothetical protein Bpfe_018751 [Biomphalaria pfeifferi]|uniref:SIPAR domain-containing protein n=1 Tax=Biomphalaria pfeifferi TaxID=112525 RepID=A0AAD8BD95_BIOPF|nr:hypothetical protein Bpfe_018751 [Biomphalaria pfeifferi]
MSRGVRDLRDLICVSRLTFNDSDEEGVYSDCDISLNKEISNLSLSDHSYANSLQDDSTLVSVTSPDSGFNTESPGLTHSKSSEACQKDLGFSKQILPSSRDQKNVKSQKKKRKKLSAPLSTSLHDLPKPTPLPPVPNLTISNVKNVDRSKSSDSTGQQSIKKNIRSNFDEILTFMDATIVASWLKRSNDAIQELTKYCSSGDNFVYFAQFWLLEFPDAQKKDIFSMEYDILLNEVALAFSVGRESKQVARRDIIDLLGAVFKEYPMRLIGRHGPYIFLDYLDILTSERQDQYKKLLSDVRCSTSNRQYAQWLLATRCFALVNVWSSVINFYRNLTGHNSKSSKNFDTSLKGTFLQRMTESIQFGFIDVVTYLIESGHIKSTYSDSHGKSLLFTAVMCKQPAIVKYFLSLVNPTLDVNQTAETGNTPLHAAANIGDLQIVELLCQCDRINVNCVNYQCEQATPLHLAVMHGHTEIIECLLKHGADPLLKMGQTTAVQLAKDLGNSQIISLLESKL